MQKPYETEEDKKICEDYLNGAYIKDLKIRYHHGSEYINSIFEKYGIQKREKLTSEIELNIVEDYKNGLSIKDIRKKYHKAGETVTKILLNNNIDYTHSAFSKRLRQMSDEQIIQLIDEYKNGKSLAYLNKKYNLHKEQIKKLLRENNIEVRNLDDAVQLSNRKYHANYDFFSSNTPEAWYMMGFIAADGNIAKYSNSLDISIQQRDAKILEDMKKYIEFTGNVKYFEDCHGHDKARLTITNKKIVDDLEKYNITRAKTFTFSVPENIPKERRSDFLLGYLDGDGWVGQDGKNAGICSVQKNVLETFLSWTEEIGVHGYIVSDKREERKATLYYLHWSKVKEIPILYHYLYDNLNRDDLFLARKKVRFERNSYLK